jgi:hypothetical protein
MQILVSCALHRIPIEGGQLDEELLPVLGTVRPSAEDDPTLPAGAAKEETGQERRLRVVRRVLEKLSTMSKFWPARTEKRSTGRGLEASEVGLALSAVDALLDCGILLQEVHGGREPRVGLDGGRRREIADLVASGEVADERLREWIEKG